MEYTIQNWQMVYDDCFLLYEKVKKDGFEPHVVIGVARGGWIPARLLADFFHLKATGNIKAEAYTMVGQEEIEPQITQPLSIDIRGKNVLLVDDVADSGETLLAVLDSIRAQEPAEIKTAVLYCKPRSVIAPDYFVNTTSNWIVFSWSIYEALSDFTRIWGKEGLDRTQIIAKCKDIGIPNQIVDTFFHE
ncbi:MAG: phosphoribosyltransferase [Candidatus Kariarchaeaceae archaeon]|jgi:hypoxanthine phosphoribosyltransferase